jgi:hypothetical protein
VLKAAKPAAFALSGSAVHVKLTRMDDARATVAVQLGRDPRGSVDVVARCPYGLPSVIRTRPRLEDGSPFPTLYYLVCPVAVRAIGRLEASGTMRVYEERLADDASLREDYARAHERYKAARDEIEVLDDPSTAGGMPERVKCLHALYAHELADRNPIGALVRNEIEPVDCPGPCVRKGDGGSMVAVTGHPGFAGKKRRR